MLTASSLFRFQVQKKKNAASPSSGRILRIRTTMPSELAPPPAPAFCTGTTGAPPRSTEDHTYGLMSGSAHNQPYKAKARWQKREAEEEEEHVTSRQDEGGALGGASADTPDERKVQELQEQLQAKVNSHPVPNHTPNSAPSLCLTLVLFCRPGRRKRGGAPPLPLL